MVVGWMFGGVECHATSKGAELSCEIYYAISFFSWILTRKYPYYVKTSTFRGYYPYFVEISTLCGYYLHFVYISVFRGYYPHFVYISVFRGNTHLPWILYAFCPLYLSNFTHLVKVTGALIWFNFTIFDIFREVDIERIWRFNYLLWLIVISLWSW